jgi:hypothetical protein
MNPSHARRLLKAEAALAATRPAAGVLFADDTGRLRAVEGEGPAARLVILDDAPRGPALLQAGLTEPDVLRCLGVIKTPTREG